MGNNMKEFLKKADWWGLVTIVPFVIVLANMVKFTEHPILYCLALTLFLVESLRSYYQGIGVGIKMIQDIKK
jgi:hypothetical protein